jgi:signal transduction histidine kinase
VVDELAQRAADADVTLATAIDVAQLKVDADLLRRILANLIDNAIRHAPERSTIKVAIDRDGAGTRLRVIDAGPGIPIDQRQHVFERFVTRGATGSGNRGLGLSFCKLAVEAQHGKIWVEDAAPGAIFCAWFPDAA